VQYVNAQLSGLVFHRSHCHIDMAYNALAYIFAALLDAPPVTHWQTGVTIFLLSRVAGSFDFKRFRKFRWFEPRTPSSRAIAAALNSAVYRQRVFFVIPFL
jgi:hypothetical protein